MRGPLAGKGKEAHRQVFFYVRDASAKACQECAQLIMRERTCQSCSVVLSSRSWLHDAMGMDVAARSSTLCDAPVTLAMYIRLHTPGI